MALFGFQKCELIYTCWAYIVQRNGLNQGLSVDVLLGAGSALFQRTLYRRLVSLHPQISLKCSNNVTFAYGETDGPRGAQAVGAGACCSLGVAAAGSGGGGEGPGGARGRGGEGSASLHSGESLCPSRNVRADTRESWILWKLMALSFRPPFIH